MFQNKKTLKNLLEVDPDYVFDNLKHRLDTFDDLSPEERLQFSKDCFLLDETLVEMGELKEVSGSVRLLLEQMEGQYGKVDKGWLNGFFDAIENKTGNVNWT